MKTNKLAFTLAETLIVLVVIGVLAVLTLSSLTKANPDRLKTMFKKSYSISERAIGEMVNDESLYPYVDMNTIGFLNTSNVQISNDHAEGPTKFCRIFSHKLNILGDVNYNSGTDRLGTITARDGVTPTGNFCHFITSDGIEWLLPVSATTNAASYPLPIYVDVDGHDNGPNSNEDSEDRDIYTILFEADGRVTVPSGGKEVQYLRSHSVNKD